MPLIVRYPGSIKAGAVKLMSEARANDLAYELHRIA